MCADNSNNCNPRAYHEEKEANKVKSQSHCYSPEAHLLFGVRNSDKKVLTAIGSWIDLLRDAVTTYYGYKKVIEEVHVDEDNPDPCP